jgi:hypothetical protein
MRLADDELRARVERAIEWDGEVSTWEDVVARASSDLHERRRRRLPRRGRATLLAAALVLAGGSLALAVGGRIVSAVVGTPAPPEIRKEFRNLPPVFKTASKQQKLEAGRVLLPTVRLLITLRTAHFGVARLYSARTTVPSGYCDLVSIGAERMFGCDRDRGRTSPRSLSVATGFTGTRSTPGANLVWGHVVPTAARTLRIRFRHGPARIVQLAGRRRFMFELGPDHSRRSTNPPIAFDVLDATGHRIATQADPMVVPR